jgi:hypothetical protein
MKVATYEGFIEDGQVKLPHDVQLPEKAKVYVVVPESEIHPVPFVASPRLIHPDQAKDFAKRVIEEGNDAGL